MYALQDYHGRGRGEPAPWPLPAQDGATRSRPITHSRELIAEFRAVTPPSTCATSSTTSSRRITLYENRAVTATTAKGGGSYEVTLKVAAKKLHADENGTQNEIPMDDWIDIGVLGKDDKPLYLQKHRIHSGGRPSPWSRRESRCAPASIPW